MTKTIKEIRRILFNNGEKSAVIGADEYTNEQARAYLFKIENQDTRLNCMENGDHLLIWGDLEYEDFPANEDWEAVIKNN